jgi:hypothetical protein
MLDNTTKGATMPPDSNHESNECYHTIIYANNKWRVIVSRCNIQWIVQRVEIKADGRRWAGKSYHTTRRALIRVFHAKTGDYNGAVALGHLPERIGGANG